MDQSELYLYGDYNSYKASQFNVQLIRCHDRDDCKSEEEITAFLKNKFLLLLWNQVRFDSRYYKEEAIKQESRIMWIPVNTQV